MRKGRPLDLNYGHLGEPIYDSENHEWQFTRVPQITQRLRAIGQPVVAHGPSLAFIGASDQSAPKRLKNIRDLTHQYPELLPSSHLLPGLAQISDSVTEITSAHDPIVSELLAFGRASDVDVRHYGKTFPIVAIAGGEAGGSVRLIVLAQEQLSWRDSKNVYLDNLSSKEGEEARWSGNGSAIQQLVFAETEGQTSSWLAVRYQGAISILRPRLRRNDFAWKSNHGGALHSRLDANHILTLTTVRSHGTQFADVAFNPWYHQQIATVDQKGHWSVWNLECVVRQRDLWEVKKAYGGIIVDIKNKDGGEPSHPEDGWGAVLWAGNTNRLVVARRRALAVFDLKGRTSQLSVPDIVSSSSSDWILDIKTSSAATSDVFIVTSSALHLIRISSMEDVAQSGIQCLLSWRHFRDLGDISLRLNLLTSSENMNGGDDVATTTVLLYSRLSGVISLFTVQHSTSSSDSAISASDPCLLHVAEEDKKDPENLDIHFRGQSLKKRISALALSVAPYGFYNAGPSSGLGHLYIENDVTFYKLSILFNDLSLSECLYSSLGAEVGLKICPPDMRTRKRVSKSSAKVTPGFVIPDGFEDEISEDSSEIISVQTAPGEVSSATQESADEDPWTISLELLLEETKAVVDSSGGDVFNQVLGQLYDVIEELCGEDFPSMDTLFGLTNRKISVNDLDKASLDFNDFLEDAKHLQLDDEDMMETSENKSVRITKISTPSMQRLLSLGEDIQMSEVYDGLINVWISPLSRIIPSRTRIALEKPLREIAAQISLSSHAVDFGSRMAGQEELGETQPAGYGAQFSLPVRRRVSATDLKKGKEPVAKSSSPLASSQISEDVGFLPPSSLGTLPTLEATPSLHSRSSVSSLTASEDPASLHIRAFAPIEPQPALPTEFRNHLNHWGPGDNPTNYDWVAAQQALASDDEDEAGEHAKQRERAEKRQKRRREPTIGPSSQPQPKRLGSSQPQQIQGDTLGSSQATPAVATASQIEPGRFGGRPEKTEKKKKKKKAFGALPGFR